MQGKALGLSSDRGCLAGGGDMGALMRSMDWSATSLGPVEQWPQSLRTSVSTCLNSRFAILIWWGPDLIMLYNDAYREIIAGKHPAALGHPGRECWPEIWDIIGPMLRSVVENGEATWSDDLLLLLERHGYPEECYFTFSYSPIRDESGAVGGVFTPVAETTERVVGERRLRTLRDLASHRSVAMSAGEACRVAAETLLANPYDVPFAALYLYSKDRSQAALVATAGIEAGSPISPRTISFDSEDPGLLGRAAATSRIEEICGLASLGSVPCGAWPVPPDSAIVLPLVSPGQPRPSGFLVAGVSPRKHLDQSYRGFYELAVGQIATAIAEAEAYESERRRAEALDELDRAKTTFFSNVSHEFRTPLTLLLGPVEGLLNRSGDAVTVDRGELDLIYRNGLRLLKLVNNLLDFSRIEAGRIRACYEPVSLDELTEGMAGVFRSAIEKAGLRLSIDCAPLTEPVYVDREMWEKIVLNLLSNAFKCTFEGGISVSLRQTTGQVELAVSDTGIGIPESDLSKVFDRFHRVEGARARTNEGSGIGLSLVRELVHLHGGTVRVESVYGRGSTFTISIPLGRDHLPADRIETPRQQSSTALGYRPHLEEALRWLPDAPDGSAGIGATSPAVPSPAPGPRARVLIADDNADMRDYLRRLLAGQYEVEAVSDGETALAAVGRGRPDLLISDVMMPGLDGFGLLHALRSRDETSDIPVMLLSARAGEEARIEGLQAGADDYVVKPFGSRELLVRVASRVEVGRLRSQAEAERRRWRALLLQAPAAIAVLRGPDHVFELVNPEFLRATRRNAADLIARPVREAMPELAGQGLFEQLDQVYGTGEALVGSERLVKLQLGEHLADRYFNFVCQRLHNTSGEVEGVFVHAVDVTEQVEVRHRIEESEKRLSAIFTQASVGIAQTDLTGRFVLANKRYCDLVGRSLEELAGCRTVDITHPDDRERTQQLYDRAVLLEEGFEIEKRYLRPGGEIVWVHKSLNAVRDERGKPRYFLNVVQDVTARKQAEEALRESEQQFRTLADSIPQLAWMADSGGSVFWYNRRWYEYTGTNLEQVSGWGWQSVHDPEVLPRVLERWRESLQTGIPFEMEFPLRGADGKFRRFLTRMIPVRDSYGSVTGWFGTNTDIEDQKRAEEAIRQKQKLESTGVLAGGVAHDFNNLLTGILGNASLVLDALPPSDPNTEELSEIVQAAERAAHLTRQMLAYAGKGSFVLEHLDLSAQVREIGALLHAAIPKQVAVEMALTPGLPAIEADRGQVQQVVMNLVINAAEAIGEDRGGRVRVATRSEILSPGTKAHFLPDRPEPGLYVVLEVEDDGAGMTEEVLLKIFDPFFSTKFTGRGLGLSAVLGIVRSSGGALSVETEPWRGSTFRVYFPAATRSAGRGARADEVRPRDRRGVVLVVDDESVVRHVAQQALERHGYSVLLAANGYEAVEILQENAARIDLVLLDVGMPLMGGEETLRALRRINPGLRVVLASGYDEREATRRFSGSSLSGFLQKPYSAARLTIMVESVLKDGA